MTDWREQRAQAIRQHLTAVDEGALWIQYFDDPQGAPVVTVAVADAMERMNECVATNVARLITQVSPRAVLLVVSRVAGAPLDEEHRLWAELRTALADSPITLIDMLVIGSSRVWSARESAPITRALQ